MSHFARYALCLLLLTLPSALSAQTRIPAGDVTVSMDITPLSAGSEYQLSVDGLVAAYPAGTFTTGVWSFPPVALSIGRHTLRARSCWDWGALGGILCSEWAAPTLDVDAVTPTPTAPTGFRIASVVVTLTP